MKKFHRNPLYSYLRQIDARGNVMAVVCDALSVIVRVWTLNNRWPGGVEGYKENAPNRTFCTDGVLTRLGFMTPIDVQVWIDRLQDQGLVFVNESMSRVEADDIVVIDQKTGPTCYCQWILTEVRDGVRWTWQNGREPGELATPEDWKPADSASLNFHSFEETLTLPWDRVGDLWLTIDSDTGETLYTAVPVEKTKSYEELIAHARRLLQIEKPNIAHQEILYAQKRRALTPEHQALAAQVCTAWALQLEDLDSAEDKNQIDALWLEAVQRWKEATDLGAGPDDFTKWTGRAIAEFRSGDFHSARWSLAKAFALEGPNSFTLLLLARISLAQGRTAKSVLTLSARAWDLADQVKDAYMVDEILEFRQSIRMHYRQASRNTETRILRHRLKHQAPKDNK